MCSDPTRGCGQIYRNNKRHQLPGLPEGLLSTKLQTWYPLVSNLYTRTISEFLEYPKCRSIPSTKSSAPSHHLNVFSKFVATSTSCCEGDLFPSGSQTMGVVAKKTNVESVQLQPWMLFARGQIFTDLSPDACKAFPQHTKCIPAAEPNEGVPVGAYL